MCARARKNHWGFIRLGSSLSDGDVGLVCLEGSLKLIFSRVKRRGESRDIEESNVKEALSQAFPIAPMYQQRVTEPEARARKRSGQNL